MPKKHTNSLAVFRLCILRFLLEISAFIRSIIRLSASIDAKKILVAFLGLFSPFLSHRGTNMVLVLEFEGAASSTDLKLGAFFTFWFYIFSVSYSNRQWMIPNAFPIILQNVT